MINRFLQNKWHVFALIFAVGMVFFANAIGGKFILDDYSLIVDNESIKSFANIGTWFTHDVLHLTYWQSNFYRPMASMVHALIFAMFGLNKVVYHLFNILVHICSAACVFVLFERLSFKKLTALFASLLFLIHPVQVESVSYIAGTSDVLSGFFVLLGLMLFSGNKKNIWSNTGIIVAMVFGFLTKESAVVFLPLAGLIWMYKGGWNHGKGRNDLWLLCVIALMTFVYLILKFTVLNFTGIVGLNDLTTDYSEHLWIRIVTFVSIIWEYFKLIFWPADLHFIKSQEFFTSIISWKGIFGLVVLFGGILGSIFSWKKFPRFGFGFMWFLIALVPVMGFIPLNTIYGERFLYVPIVGVIWLVAAGFEYFCESKYKVVALYTALALLLLLGGRTMLRNSDWSNDLRFYQNELKYDETSPRINNEMCAAYMNEHDYDKAAEHCETSVKAKSDFGPSHFNLANTYMNLGRIDEALDQYYEAIHYAPKFSDAYKAVFQIYTYITKETAKADAFQVLLNKLGAGEDVPFESFLSVKNM